MEEMRCGSYSERGSQRRCAACWTHARCSASFALPDGSTPCIALPPTETSSWAAFHATTKRCSPLRSKSCQIWTAPPLWPSRRSGSRSELSSIVDVTLRKKQAQKSLCWIQCIIGCGEAVSSEESAEGREAATERWRSARGRSSWRAVRHARPAASTFEDIHALRRHVVPDGHMACGATSCDQDLCVKY